MSQRVRTSGRSRFRGGAGTDRYPISARREGKTGAAFGTASLLVAAYLVS